MQNVNYKLKIYGYDNRFIREIELLFSNQSII